MRKQDTYAQIAKNCLSFAFDVRVTNALRQDMRNAPDELKADPRNQLVESAGQAAHAYLSGTYGTMHCTGLDAEVVETLLERAVNLMVSEANEYLGRETDRHVQLSDNHPRKQFEDTPPPSFFGRNFTTTRSYLDELGDYRDAVQIRDLTRTAWDYIDDSVDFVMKEIQQLNLNDNLLAQVGMPDPKAAVAVTAQRPPHSLSAAASAEVAVQQAEDGGPTL